ncbi:MAG: hypothetical protein JNJ83_20470 [Verrucomicrobiaceae bacterium]|nr:hypothetical protein [Verrucomicrobiaceae bacterium]
MSERTFFPTILALAVCSVSMVVGTEPAARPVPPVLKVHTAPPSTKPESPAWSSDQTPADFLDNVGGRLKIRWRQHYREAAPVPSNERTRGAFVLGSLLADSFLALQATDAQQFRNTNQDVMNYARTLGLSEKLTPRLMSQGKLAEMEQWPDLRQEVVDGHQELCRLLREQKDDDLAILVDLGVWIRLLQLVSTVVDEGDEQAKFPLCIGSPKLVEDLQARWSRLSQPTQVIDRIDTVGHTITFMAKAWLQDLPADKARVTKTREKLAELVARITSR